MNSRPKGEVLTIQEVIHLHALLKKCARFLPAIKTNSYAQILMACESAMSAAAENGKNRQDT